MNKMNLGVTKTKKTYEKNGLVITVTRIEPKIKK
jgi:hypothetical protein